MNPFIPTELVGPRNNPGNVTRDMLPQFGERSNPNGDGRTPFTSTGLQVTPAPQQRVIPSRQGNVNAAGDPNLIPSREILDQIGSASGSTIVMGSSQGVPPRLRSGGMDTSLSGARQRSGRG
jgi:hypothetical protein